MKYDSDYFKSQLIGFDNMYSPGKTIMNNEIYCIKIGTGKIPVLFTAAYHGLEYLTAYALLGFLKKFLDMSVYHDKISLYAVPMVNPDGVDIAVKGINPKNFIHRIIIKKLGIIDFTHLWQSNAFGVDINHNFDADWDKVTDNISYSKYGGEYPGSEIETKIITELMEQIKPDLFLAFHSQGKEIYYDFNGMENKDAKAAAEKIAAECGYTVATPTDTAAFGGAKDFFIQKYHKKAFTIELGEGKNPLPNFQLSDMTKDVEKICIAALNELIT